MTADLSESISGEEDNVVFAIFSLKKNFISSTFAPVIGTALWKESGEFYDREGN
jgi:hypothetical protein